ncbi:class Ib ribonucleoside-diphosphate reductase assembly flavoprotein NrdI [Paenibacillus vulneris]|uniref:Class Ib ribonucleoside-diphosphate reductase assembly flavoprotein NrdI n=1 Tax=Paenibacillus vulneris TaxID=1133364 RepID=A0ABW3UGX2_9BACL
MLIVYDSKTRNVERFINKLNIRNVKIHNEMEVRESYILITYTTGMGQVPESTLKFLDNNYSYLKGVASSGNKNWGKSFALAADIISNKYNVPVICKFELSGTVTDINRFIQEVKKFV